MDRYLNYDILIIQIKYYLTERKREREKERERERERESK